MASDQSPTEHLEGGEITAARVIMPGPAPYHLGFGTAHSGTSVVVRIETVIGVFLYYLSGPEAIAAGRSLTTLGGRALAMEPKRLEVPSPEVRAHVAGLGNGTG